jgi:plastocyanin
MLATNSFMKKKIIWILLAAIALTVLFLLLKPKESKAPTQTAAPKSFAYQIQDGQILKGPETIKVTQGDTVVIMASSNVNDELHLHGYDKKVLLEPNKPTAITFTANRTGRFELELHKSDKVIATVEIQPKP